MLPLQTEQSVSEESEENSDLFEVSLNLPSWWTKGSPRLLATDTPEHVESVVATNTPEHVGCWLQTHLNIYQCTCLLPIGSADRPKGRIVILKTGKKEEL